MLDVGFSEILLTSAIALIVLGPERLPKVARQVGSWMGRARAMARQLSEQLEREVSADELLKTQSKPDANAQGSIGGPYPPVQSIAPPMADAAPPAAPPAPAVEPPEATVAPEATAAPAEVEPGAVDVPAKAPEPVYGLPASATTAAAMHASDPPALPPHE